jgi:hypothetical protein
MDEIERPKKPAFLAAYAELGNITQAAEVVGMSRTMHYMWLEDDPAYQAAFKAANEQACDRLRQEARRRAVEGTDKPVFYQGAQCGTIREYSDTLLIFLMKGAMPDEFRERQQVDVNQSGSVRVCVVEDDKWFGVPQDDDLAEGIAAPTAGNTLAGPHEAAGVRTPVGQDGDGHDVVPERPRTTEGN